MTNTTYKELADAVFDKMKSYGFARMSEKDAYDIVIGYIRPSIVKFENCKQNLSNRDDLLKEFNFKLTDNTFFILTNYMIIEWLDSNYILVDEALKSYLTPSDFKSLENKDMLTKKIELRENLLKEAKQLSINKSYTNSRLFEVAIGKKKVF